MEPWTQKELDEIARLRKAGHDESYIRGCMKVSRHSNNIPPVAQRSKPMATKKKAGSKKKVSKKKVSKKAAKKTSKKKVSKKKVTKKAGRKAGVKAGRKQGGFTVGEKLTAVKGKDDEFYKKFPRYKAYQLLCAKGSMATADFVNAVEKLDGVRSRQQALGILTKLLEKDCARASGAKKVA